VTKEDRKTKELEYAIYTEQSPTNGIQTSKDKIRAKEGLDTQVSISFD